MRAQTLRSLLDGHYICPVAFPHEYAFLTSDGNEASVDRWLSDLEMCLARVDGEGAFFMAPRIVSKEDGARIPTLQQSVNVELLSCNLGEGLECIFGQSQCGLRRRSTSLYEAATGPTLRYKHSRTARLPDAFN